MPEPNVVVLGGNPGSWSSQERAAEASTMTGIEAWVFAFDGQYRQGVVATSRDLHGQQIIIANSNTVALKNLLRLAENRPSDCKWVTLIEGDALDYTTPQRYIRDLLDASDLVGCINKYSKAFFQALTSSRVEYIGIPYPAEGIRALATPTNQRRKEIFLAPMLLSRWLEYISFKDIGLPMYGYEKRLSRKWRTIGTNIRNYGSLDSMYFHNRSRSLYRDPALTIRREERLPDFFRHTGGSLLWLNLDHRYTWGRYVLDAAALQVPIVTTRSTGHGETFFPKTILEHEFELEKAHELVQRLLTDPNFYEEVATIPIEHFDKLRPEAKKNELMNILFS